MLDRKADIKEIGEKMSLSSVKTRKMVAAKTASKGDVTPAKTQIPLTEYLQKSGADIPDKKKMKLNQSKAMPTPTRRYSKKNRANRGNTNRYKGVEFEDSDTEPEKEYDISEENIDMNDIKDIYDTLADVEVDDIEEVDLKSLVISNRTLPVLLRSMLDKIET